MKQNAGPYVVSADIHLLLKDWARRRNFHLPPDEFFQKLRKEFINYMMGVFPQFEFVAENELKDGLNRLVRESDLAPISLDRVYAPSQYQLDITRLINENGQDRGWGRRFGTSPLIKQFSDLRKLSGQKVCLVDDVIFTGHFIERVIKDLFRMNIEVAVVCAGIGIAGGINRITNTNREIKCVRYYPKVIDEICERDFYPGTPFSGRLILESQKTTETGAPYLLPFGLPTIWASIPLDQEFDFSQLCLQQSIWLWRKIEEYSRRLISCSDLDRRPRGVPYNDSRFVDKLIFFQQKILTKDKYAEYRLMLH